MWRVSVKWNNNLTGGEETQSSTRGLSGYSKANVARPVSSHSTLGKHCQKARFCANGLVEGFQAQWSDYKKHPWLKKIQVQKIKGEKGGQLILQTKQGIFLSWKEYTSDGDDLLIQGLSLKSGVVDREPTAPIPSQPSRPPGASPTQGIRLSIRRRRRERLDPGQGWAARAAPRSSSGMGKCREASWKSFQAIEGEWLRENDCGLWRTNSGTSPLPTVRLPTWICGRNDH